MKITKNQLRQLIKEEIQKELELNEGFGLVGDALGEVWKVVAGFFTGENQLSADDQETVRKRSEYWLKEYPEAAGGGNAAKKWAMSIALSEFRAGELDRQGNIKGPEKKADPEYLKDLGLPSTWVDFASEKPEYNPNDSHLQRIWKAREAERKKKERGY